MVLLSCAAETRLVLLRSAAVVLSGMRAGQTCLCSSLAARLEWGAQVAALGGLDGAFLA